MKYLTNFGALCLFLMVVLCASLVSNCWLSQLATAQAEDFAHPAFKALWEKSDKPVAENKIVRPWLWGDAPFATKNEAYDEASASTRLVQYFDKSRMELNNPYSDKNSPYYVTNGLLTKELVSGQMQVGDNRYLDGLAAEIPVAGDGEANPDCPTYATFGKAGLVSLGAGEGRSLDLSGQPVLATLNRAGQTGQSLNLAGKATYTYYNPELGHNIPDVFWNWLNKLDTDWVFAMGYPISEPYWVQARLGGESKTILVQLFERRILTYTPGNAPVWQVEMGNIGRHYYQWRYEAGTARVLDYRTYKSEVDRTRYFVGVFQNETNVEQRVRLTVSLLDGSGKVLADSDTEIDSLTIVPAKGKSPFRLLLANAPTSWSEVRSSAEFLPFFKTFKSNYNYNLQPAGVSLGRAISGLPRLSGRLTNLGQGTSRYSQVFAVAYDSDGKVLDVESGYSSPQRIEPGDTAPFEVLFLRARDFSRYEIFTEGRS